jgi:hypothetical protein
MSVVCLKIICKITIWIVIVQSSICGIKETCYACQTFKKKFGMHNNIPNFTHEQYSFLGSKNIIMKMNECLAFIYSLQWLNNLKPRMSN